MNGEDFREAVARERLTRWVQVGPPDGTSANRVCVFESGGIWQLVITDERAGVREPTRRRFADESEAFESAVDSARMLKSILT